MTIVAAVRGLSDTTESFRQKAVAIASRLSVDPSWMFAGMSFETGGTFSPSIVNKVSGATGLIQFMPATARGLGTTTADLAKMTAEDQLDYVDKYFKPYASRIHSVGDLYMAQLYPAAMGKSDDSVLFAGSSKEYAQNSAFDRDKKGYVTVGDATKGVVSLLSSAKGTISVGDGYNLPPYQPPVPLKDVSPVMTTWAVALAAALGGYVLTNRYAKPKGFLMPARRRFA